MNTTNNNVTKNRFALPAGCKPASRGISIALTAVSAILAGAFPSGYGGITLLIVAIGLFAYVLTASFSFVYMGVGAVISVLVAVLCGVKFPLALVALIYIPMAFVISEAARRKSGLTGTVAAMTVTLVIILGIAGVICYLTMGNALTEAIKNIANSVFEDLEMYVDKLNQAAQKDVYTENYVEALKNALVLLLPSVVVLVCMGISYLSAKFFRLATIVADSNEMFLGRTWPISASLASSVVFAASYIVSMFAFKSEIVYYSATNIMYIVLPAQAIVGFKLLFGKKGLLRSERAKKMKWITIIICVYFALINPMMLLILASMFTIFYNFRMWWAKRKRNSEE